MTTDQKIKDLAEALSWMTNFITSWREAAATNSHGDLKNSAEFIINFITIINGVSDSYDLNFDGDGSYFGKQISISFDARLSYTGRDIAFEICYDENQMVIYTKHHQGFWVLPYVTVTTHDDAFEKLKVAIHSAIHRLMDLNALLPSVKLVICARCGNESQLRKEEVDYMTLRSIGGDLLERKYQVCEVTCCCGCQEFFNLNDPDDSEATTINHGDVVHWIAPSQDKIKDAIITKRDGATVVERAGEFKELEEAIQSNIYHLLNSNAVNHAQKLKQYFIREIGEGDWVEVTQAQYQAAQLDPTMDAKMEVV